MHHLRGDVAPRALRFDHVPHRVDSYEADGIEPLPHYSDAGSAYGHYDGRPASGHSDVPPLRALDIEPPQYHVDYHAADMERQARIASLLEAGRFAQVLRRSHSDAAYFPDGGRAASALQDYPPLRARDVYQRPSHEDSHVAYEERETLPASSQEAGVARIPTADSQGYPDPPPQEVPPELNAKQDLVRVQSLRSRRPLDPALSDRFDQWRSDSRRRRQ